MQLTTWLENIVVTSNFSFSYNVFKRLVLETRKSQGLFGKGLKLKSNRLFKNNDAGLSWFLFQKEAILLNISWWLSCVKTSIYGVKG